MNLGRRRITNDELCAAFRALRFRDVAAFLASGNVIFSTTEATGRLEELIATGLERELQYPVPTFVRSGAELEAVVRGAPFSAAELASAGKPQVLFLARAMTEEERCRVEKLSTAGDRVVAASREIYWLPRGRMTDSALDLKEIERAVGPVTIRTLRTVERIVATQLR